MRPMFILSSLLVVGCGNAVEVGGTGTQSSPLTGSWLSQGADVAPLLAGAPFNNTKITAIFKDDGTYTVISIDTSNKELDYSGTYQTMASGINGIVQIRLAEVVPTTAQVEGMYQIDSSQTPARMQYEAVQTQPTNGLTPPAPDKGFGSTIYNGMQISTLIQKFTRQ
jgi:hypothetical protein